MFQSSYYSVVLLNNKAPVQNAFYIYKNVCFLFNKNLNERRCFLVLYFGNEYKTGGERQSIANEHATTQYQRASHQISQIDHCVAVQASPSLFPSQPAAYTLM